METFRFILEKYKGKNSRYDCPQCKAKKRFTRYVDTETGEYVADEVGICDRVNSCGYHVTPKEYFGRIGVRSWGLGVRSQETRDKIQETSDKGTKIQVARYKRQDKRCNPPTLSLRRTGGYNWCNECNECNVSDEKSGNCRERGFSVIDEGVLMGSLEDLEGNGLYGFMVGKFGVEMADEVFGRYLVGTFNYPRAGSTVFWQVDREYRIRSGKIICYDSETGKRNKAFGARWVHSWLMKSGRIAGDFNLKQCLFGEHLLDIDVTKPVAVVESEKTALLASIVLPEFIWMATGGLQEFKESKLRVLVGRKVIAFPDMGGFGLWSEKAKGFSFPVVVSGYLEGLAGATDSGADVGDFI
jgi:hypothetical protein